MDIVRPLPLRWQLALLAVLAVAAYLPSLNIPLIADDYPNIAQAITEGANGMGTLLHDAQFRLRSTSYWIWFAVWRAGGMNPLVCHAVSVTLHVLNTWLVLGVGLAWAPMRKAAFWAAVFFAVHEGHQEAVMWYSAISELLTFGFGATALWCFLQRRWTWDAAAWTLFALALLSKESAVILAPLFLLTLEPGRWKRDLARLTPFAVLAGLAVLSLAARNDNFRLHDGSFSLHAPFWLTWPHSMARLLWVWGWLALIAVAILGDPRVRRTAALTLAWMAVAFVPYIFLTYSTAIPSRQTYLASAGLALLVGLALAQFTNRRAMAALLALIVVENCSVLWTRKRAQFLERAAPTSQLISTARRTRGAVWLQCFPLPSMDAEDAMELGAGRPASDLVWDARTARMRGAATFCYQESKRSTPPSEPRP